MEVQTREIQVYLDDDGASPFDRWLDNLRDSVGKARIRLRLKRVKLGNLGDCKPVGDGVYEMRVDVGPGYRVYFGQIGSTVVLLLCGGDKGSQDRDILKAKEYWEEYEKHPSSND